MAEKCRKSRMKAFLRVGFCLAVMAAMILVGVVMAGAEDVKYSEGLSFSLDGNGNCTVGLGSCTDTEIVIPPTSPDGDMVTRISTWAFSGNKKITSISIPENVTSIGNYTFRGCYNLKSITIPSSMKHIMSMAFLYCDNITDIYYYGTEAEWNLIEFGSNNGSIGKATVHYLVHDNHVHNYEKIVTLPTCTVAGYTTYVCDCGDSYIGDNVSALRHTFS